MNRKKILVFAVVSLIFTVQAIYADEFDWENVIKVPAGIKICTLKSAAYGNEFGHGYYDAKGNLISVDETDYSSGGFQTAIEYKYNTKGQLTERFFYYDGVESSKTTFSYNNSGKIKSTKLYIFEDGEFVHNSDSEYKYNSKGNKTEIITKDISGNVLSKTVFKYNLKNLLTESLLEFYSDTGETTTTIVSKYDESGYLIEDIYDGKESGWYWDDILKNTFNDKNLLVKIEYFDSEETEEPRFGYSLEYSE